MGKTKVLVINASDGAGRIKGVADKLSAMGVYAEMLDSVLKSVGNYHEQIVSAIANAKIIVFFISEKFISSKSSMNTLMMAYSCAKERDKLIIPVVEWQKHLDTDKKLQYLLAGQQIVFPYYGLHSQQDQIGVAGKIFERILNVEGKELLYDKISSLSQIDYAPGISSNLSELILLLCHEVENESMAQNRRNTYKEILRCMEQLETCGEPGYTNEDRALAKKCLSALDEVDKILKSNDFHKLDLFLIAFVLKIIYLDYRIRTDVIDTLTNGDVHGLGMKTYEEKYLARQNFYLKMYNSQMIAENISEANHGPYSEDEFVVIMNAKQFLFSDVKKTIVRKNTVKPDVTESEKQLHAIADYMRESNRLFELAGNERLAADFVKCLKTSYERLRKYSEVVGCVEVCAECIERIAEINHQLEMLDDADSGSSLAESGIKALLGFSLPGSDKFDVFLSYKHEDNDIARNVYHYLRSNLLNPFYDSVTLPELSKSEYEDAIMNAIEHSKHFVVIISDLSYLDSYWVDLEMKTFRHEMVEGRKEGANFLILVTNEVYNKILSTNKQCLPIKYRSYEIMRLDVYKKSIVKYLR